MGREIGNRHEGCSQWGSRNTRPQLPGCKLAGITLFEQGQGVFDVSAKQKSG
jgi:hypothetical protein